MKQLSTLFFLSLFLLLFAIQGINQPLLTAAQPEAAPVAQANQMSQADVAEALQSSPVMFIENVGQFDEDARFKVHGGDYSLWLADDALWITLFENQPIEQGLIENNDQATTPPSHHPTNQPTKGVNLKLSFVNANPQPEIEPFNLLETKMNYFLGNDSDKWRSDVPVYGGVRYKDLYPGIDLELTSQDGQIVQRLVARSDASLDEVQLRVEGAEELQLLPSPKVGRGAGGEGMSLRVSTAIGDVSLPLFSIKAPDGTPLDSTLTPTLNGNQILAPFAPDNPDKQDRALTPDGTLIYSTFIGGTSDDHGYSLALDSAGNAVVTGKTSSSDFPTTPGYDTQYNAGSDVFVLKLNSAGNDLVYSTFVGGFSDDAGYSLALDSAGNAYVTGATYSSNFPTPNAYDPNHHGNQDVFVFKLNAAGNSLPYGTFIGGSSEDVGNSLALDSAGNIYVTGWTESANFSPQGGYDTFYSGGGDAFVFKLNLEDLIYSTFIGGSQYDYGSELVVDSSGRVVVTGNTQSSDFPTTLNSYDTTLDDASDIFVLQLNQAGNDLDYSTFIGGSDYDFGCGLALDSSGNVIVTGGTSSDNFPTQAGYDTSHNGFTDSFILKLSSGGNNLLYSTFIGGTNSEYSCEVALDSAGNPVITGATWSSDFPTTAGSYDTTQNGSQDAFLVQLSEAGDALLYSSFLGGTDFDIGNGLALDSAGNAYVTGYTSSSNFPTTSASYDTSYNSGSDVFVSKLTYATPTTCPEQYRAEYYDNQTLSGNPAFVQCEDWPINHDWGGNGPGNGLPSDSFSARWTSRATIQEGDYTFIYRSDDGMRVWLDNELIIDNWNNPSLEEGRITRHVSTAEYEIKVEYYESVGAAVAYFGWEEAASTPAPDLGFRPNPNGYKFPNYGGNYPNPPVDYTVNDAIRMFGEDAVCATKGTCVPKSTANQWIDYANRLMNGGHCDGFTTTSLRFFKGLDHPADFQSGANSVHDLEMVNMRRHMAYYWVLQIPNPVASARYQALQKTPSEVLEQLVTAMLNGATDPTTLIVYNSDRSSGHSVTPYAIEDRGNGLYHVKVYDNNHPDEERYVEINTTNNTWRYNLGWETWSGDASSNSLGAIPISTYAQQPTCPWCESSRGVAQGQMSLEGKGHLLILLITDSQGQRIGYVGEQFINEIPEAFASVIPGGLGIPTEPTYYLPLSSNTYTILLDGQPLTQTESVAVTQFGPGYAISVDDIELTTASQDQLTFASDGTKLTYQSSNDKQAALSLALDQSNASYQFQVQEADVGTGETVALEADMANNQLLFSNNQANNGLYTAKVTRVDAAGESVFLHTDLNINSNETHAFDFGSWDGEGEMTVCMDQDGDGSTDECETLENEYVEWRLYLPSIMR